MKKSISLVMSLLLVFTVVTSFFGYVPKVKAEPRNSTYSVTLHKLLMSKEELDAFETPDAYDGSQTLDQLKIISGNKTLTEVADVYFAWQNEAGKWIDAIGAEVDSPEKALGGLTTASGKTFDTRLLPEGKYRIVEVDSLTTYVDPATKAILADSKAVPVEINLPLRTSTGTGFVENAHVYPKNTQEVPTVEKQVEGQDETNGQLGQVLTYTVHSTIKAGSRYQNLVWKDTMSNGLTYNRGSLAIAADNGVALASPADYTLLEDDRGFSLALTVAGLAKVSAVTNPAGQGNGADLNVTLTYKATINSNAIVREKNIVKLDYSNEPGQDITPTPVTPTPDPEDPAKANLTLTKSWTANDGSPIDMPTDTNAVVAYTLYKAGTAVATVQVTPTTTKDSVITLGNGITFVPNGAFGGTFRGLVAGAIDYTISERVSGYTPTITAGADGTVSVTNKKNKIPEILSPADAYVNLYGKRFVKTDSQDANKRLQGAQFVVAKGGHYVALKTSEATEAQQQELTDAKAALDAAVAAYNKLPVDQQTAVEKAKVSAAQERYNAAFVAAKITYTLVGDKNDPNVLKLTSNQLGQFEVTGLEAGTYSLIEIEAPKGYALASEGVEFVVGTKPSADNIAYQPGSPTIDALRINNTNLTIPQTGGIGTIIFAVAGATIMGIALYAYMKNNKDEEQSA